RQDLFADIPSPEQTAPLLALTMPAAFPSSAHFHLFLTIHGSWTPWSPWSDCPVTCGNGTHVRTRACINPPPRNNGSDCAGPEAEAQGCAARPCPGKWPWSPCSRSCGTGLATRTGTCACPSPEAPSTPCNGSARQEVEPCYLRPCEGRGTPWGREGLPWSQGALSLQGHPRLACSGAGVPCMNRSSWDVVSDPRGRGWPWRSPAVHPTPQGPLQGWPRGLPTSETQLQPSCVLPATPLPHIP
uniref:SCO-spondin n=1 Tax=Chelydra serpentina TaxID=8475 RepID=A0A8C3T440_CHESE